jgi:hypothetical protein
MMTYQQIANELKVDPKTLEHDSLKTYFEHELKIIEAELFSLAAKYGVKTIEEFNRAVEKGRFREKEAFEDYFAFDNLESRKKKVSRVLESL